MVLVDQVWALVKMPSEISIPFTAAPAAAAQNHVAQYRDVLPGLDGFATGRAARAWYDEVELAFRQVRRQRVLQFFALIAPLALHHDRQAVDDDIQEATDHQGKGQIMDNASAQYKKGDDDKKGGDRC